jgi:ribosome biogenesis GTPase A
MTNSDLPHSRFDLSIRYIVGAGDLLRSDCRGESIARRTGEACGEELGHVLERIELVKAERPGRVCVLILGEFKAGKSTLINALLRRVVAAVDVFEMTTAVCRIVPSVTGAEGAELRARDRSVPPLRLSLADFLARSQERALGPYTQVNLHVNSDLDLVLVDTPGLGATLENEIAAVDALATADVVLWTLDADSLGGAREAAVITGAQETGLPLICVLTKADVLAEEEVAEAIEYIGETFRMPPQSIIPVSATQALQRGSDKGVDRLRQHLIQRIAPRGAILREQALLAHAADIAAELTGILDQVISSLGNASQQLGEYRDALGATARTVAEDVCSELTSRLRDGLVLEINARIDARLGDAGDSRTLSEADIASVLKDSTQSLSGQPFWSALSDQVEHRIQAEWSDGIRAQIAVLVSSLNEVRHDADRDAARMAEELLQVQVYETQRKEASVVYGLETVSAAILGTVFSGGNLFIGILSAAPLFYRWYKSGEEAQNAPSSYGRRLLLQETIEAWVNETVRRMIDEQFHRSLLEINLRVAEEAAKAYALKQEKWPLPYDRLNELIGNCETAKENLSEIRKGRNSALSPPAQS